jgi:hypothetical protein
VSHFVITHFHQNGFSYFRAFVFLSSHKHSSWIFVHSFLTFCFVYRSSVFPSVVYSTLLFMFSKESCCTCLKYILVIHVHTTVTIFFAFLLRLLLLLLLLPPPPLLLLLRQLLLLLFFYYYYYSVCTFRCFLNNL